jgi:hypothetical protein
MVGVDPVLVKCEEDWVQTGPKTWMQCFDGVSIHHDSEADRQDVTETPI